MDKEVLYERWMRQALTEAQAAAEEGEVPVGCLIYDDTTLIAKAHNQKEQLNDPTAHAEILAITQACAARDDWRLEGCTLVVTKEPCVMCTGAILAARVSTVVFGVPDPEAGACVSVLGLADDLRFGNGIEIVAGVEEDACRTLIQDFFRARRKKS